MVLKIFGSNTTDIDDDMITVNNFFTRWLNEINVVRYTDDITILPSNTTVPIADYAANILKHMTDNQLNTIKKTLLYSKEMFIFRQIGITEPIAQLMQS